MHVEYVLGDKMVRDNKGNDGSWVIAALLIRYAERVENGTITSKQLVDELE